MLSLLCTWCLIPLFLWVYFVLAGVYIWNVNLCRNASITIKLSDSDGPVLQATTLILIFSIHSFTFDFSLSLFSLSHSFFLQPVTQSRWLQWPESSQHWCMDSLIKLLQLLVHHKTEPEVYFPDISETTIHIAWMLILGWVYVVVYFSLPVCLFVVVYTVMIFPIFWLVLLHFWLLVHHFSSTVAFKLWC